MESGITRHPPPDPPPRSGTPNPGAPIPTRPHAPQKEGRECSTNCAPRSSNPSARPSTTSSRGTGTARLALRGGVVRHPGQGEPPLPPALGPVQGDLRRVLQRPAPDDPYSFTDPRQYYYAPYVTSRAGTSDAFGATLAYLESRDLLERLPAGWKDLLAQLVIPLRHYESGAQLISTAAARFGFGTTITQCAAYAAFDRIGNAQLISRLGIALDGGTAGLLEDAKASWMDGEALQGLRRLVEETIVEKDWALALITLDVTDQLLYRVLFAHLDDAALTGGAPRTASLHSTWPSGSRTSAGGSTRCTRPGRPTPSWGRPTPRSSRAPSPTPSTGACCAAAPRRARRRPRRWRRRRRARAAR